MPYHISAEQKQAFLSDMHQKDFVLNGVEYPTPEQLQSIADKYYLAPGFTTLLESLADGDKSFMSDVFSALTEGVDSEKLPARWLVRIWDVVSSAITQPELYAAADAVIKCHQRLLQGDEVDKVEWRQLRRRFSSIEEDLSGAAAEVIAAGAWDPAVAPLAIRDALPALESLSMQQWLTDVNWSNERLQQCYRDDEAASQYAREQMGVFPENIDGETPEGIETVQRWITECNLKYTAFCKENCPDVFQRGKETQQRWAALLQQSRGLFIQECAALT